jgi:hypothetical protein
LAFLEQKKPDLAEIVGRWDSLSPAVKQAVLGLVKAVAKGKAK